MDDRSKLVKSLSADELRRLMERLKKGQPGAERIGRAPRDGAPLPLSFAQERLWFLDRLGANSSAYNVPAAVRLAGALDTPALRRTFTEVVRRHESLRTTFAESDGVPFQVIALNPATPLPVADLSGLPAGAREREMLRLATAEADRPFDLTRGPLFRTLLFRLGSAEHVLTVTLHHIVSDGWSTGVMIREMAALYAAFTAGRPSPLPDLPIQYADYAVWQRRRLSGETLAKELAFWRERLAGTPPLELPADRPRPLQMSFAGGHRGIEIEGALLAAANALCREAEGTLYMVLLAAFEALLLRYSGQADFAVGAPVANRGRSETEGLIGLFVNTLALRASLADGLTFRGLLEQVKEGTLAAFAHEDMPFDKLVEELQPDREPGRNPLFQVITTLQNQPRPELAMGSLALSVLEVENATAKVDLTLAWTEQAGRLMGSVEYSSALFDGATAERLARHFQTLLDGAVANPGQTLWELPLLDGAERRQTLIDWNRTASDYPRESTIHALFEAEAERNPGAVAVEIGDTRLTYGELNTRANQIAHRLRRLGVGPEALVVLSIPRSLEMIEGMLGILKAGGAYLPLDPSLPRERLAFLVEESQPAALVTLEAHLDALPGFAGRAVCLDRDRSGLDAERADAPPSGVTADNLVYVLYTSGSTGRPKAVAVPHRGLVRLVRGADYARLDSGETFFQFAPLSFDPSTLEIFGALANGGRLAVAPAGPFSLSELGQVIRRHGVTTLWLTSGLFHQMIEEGLDDLRGVRQLLSGGDVLSPVHIRRALEALPGVEIIDGYGPTENSCFTTCYRVDLAAPPGAYVPIGRPVANTTVYILDRELRPVPIGIPGELLTGGDGLARGYRGRPELTAERFVPSPFSGGPFDGDTDPPGARLYRTGDLSRWRPDGDIEFLGRMDNQVKIRGYRIEPGEVEAVLASHPALAECAVVVRREASGERRLVACYVAAEPVTPAALKEHLAVTLPAYMVPAAFLELPALPLTTSGKVDRRALSRLEVQAGDGPSEEYAEPRTPVEKQIAAIWSDLLKRERIGLHDNFFDLGGHSLLATRVLSRLRESLSADLSLTTVFERPTLSGLAAAVEGALGTPLPAAPPLAGEERADEPLETGFGPIDEGEEWEGPRTPVEVLLAGIFSELLGVARVGRTDSFFHLGGHSLMATRLLARVRRELGVDLPLQSLFEAATVAELAALIQEAGRPRTLAAEEPVRSGGLPLSFAQERLWFLEQLQPGTSAYNIPAPVRLRGPLSPAALAGALEEVVRRHQILRVTLGEREGRAVQWVSPPAAIPFPLVDLSALPNEPREAEGLRVITEEARLPFDLQQGPLLRARLLRHAPGDHVMILTIHHIAADGWSMGVLIRELLALYQAALGGLPSPFPEPARQYFDFGRWQRGALQGETLERLLAYWRRTLAGLPEVLELPADRPRPPVRSFHGHVLRFSLDAAVARSLHAAAREARTTMFMTLLAGFDVLLARYSQQEDFAVGSAIANRNRGEDEGLIGFFVNTLVLRARPAGGLTFRELLGQVRGTTLGAYEHQDLPFERIVEEVRPERSLAHSPLFQVALTLQNNEVPAVALAGLTAEGVRTPAVTAKFDLSLFLEEAAGGLSGSVEYATDLFDEPTVQRLAAHLGTLLAAAAAAPDTRLAELPVLDVDEHRQILSRRRAAAPPRAVPMAVGLATLTRRPPDGRDLPLSFSQERLWFLDRLEPGKAAYNIAVTVRMIGDLKVAALAATFDEVLRRHEALRTVFVTVEGAPRQRVPPFAGAAVPLIDLADLPRPARDREASRVGQQYADWHFDLTRGPMLVAALLRIEPALHHCAAVFHHIASDGWSIGILFHEISVLYPAFLEGRPSPLPELAIQYPDYALWQRRAMAGTLEREVGYWMAQLDGEIAPLELPIDRPRPAVQSYRGASRTLILPPALGARLTALSHREGCTLFMTLLAAAKVLLHRQSGQDDILMGAPIAGRQRIETEELIGFFLNTLVLRTDLAGDPTFRELLARVRRVTLGAYSHQEVPFEGLLARLPQQRDPSRTPLFQVMFNMLNMPDGRPIPLPGLTIEPFAVPELPSKFDLTFYVTDLRDEGIFFHLLYNADLFTDERMEEMLAQLAFLLEQAAAAPATPIEALSLVTPAALAALPDPAAALDATWVGAIHDLFSARAAAAPKRTAIADREGSWSYGELETASNRLANRLVAEGTGKGERVAIWVHRSAPVAVAVLGALKAGAAFTMLDPAYPPSRLVEILRVAAPRALVRLEAAGALPDGVEAWLVEAGCRQVDLPRGGAAAVLERLAGFAGEPPAVTVGPDDIAVIGFTSGSTGTPKGIAGRHGPLTHFFPWQCERFGLSAEDRFSLLSGLAHDPLQRDLFTPFYLGATVVVPNPEDIGVSGRLAAWLARERVTVAHLTPAMAQILTERASHGAAVEAPNLRFVLLVGDALTRLDVARIRRLAPGVTCVNLYGSTETQRAVAYHVVEETGEDARQVLPLGAGMKDAQLLVINRAGRLAGIGEVGEIAVRSPHLARGYLGDAALTADKFQVNPFTNEAGDRIYRTGDLGRYLPDGEVTFAGRADLQVKIRGFRIEPAEIEARLAALPGVREAVVVAREDRGEKRLVAYVVAEGTGTSAGTTSPTLLRQSLRQALRDRLPAYMVPSAFVLLERLPITPNGKIDRRALPAPVEEAAEARGAALPESAVEETIAAVWREVLGVEKVGVNDNFFDVGGHSLLLVRLHSRLEEVLGREISLLELFNHPNIRSQADHLGGRAQALQPARRPEPAAAAEGSAPGGIAIVGLAGRFPAAADVEALWRNLREGVEAISFFSTEEVVASTGLPAEAIADPRVVKARGVLAGEAMFDAEFFDVAPRQAELMDPQLRHFLECSWEALENAGYDPARFPGQIGVYGGVTLSSYFLNNLQSNPRLILEMGTHQTAIATDRDFLTSQVSYKLNLRGPSLTVQTACSTSLVATHLACLSLLAGECDMALAGGVSIKVPQVTGYLYQEGGLDSSDGHCRSFDAKADGSVYGSGVGIVVLKRLEDALADGDTVHAVILGSAINNDGSAKVGFTAPSIEGQSRAIAEAHAAAGIAPESIGYVECHGSGTALGDPIEVAALARAFATPERGFCPIGSVKSSIGHLGAAAGIAGLIKTVLALEHRQIPASLHFETPNPRIDFAASPFFVNNRLADWPADRGPRRAGVSSFGIGGTNAHAVLEEAPAPQPTDPGRPWQLLVLSARSESALEAASDNLAGWLERHPEADLADVAHTLRVGRQAFAWRRALVCRSADEAGRALAERDPQVLRTAHTESGGRAPVAFLFPGVDGYDPGMASGLQESEPVFRAEHDRCLGILESKLGEDPARFAEPLLFAFEYALARLWESWGVRPGAMTGDGVGEIVAACLAGGLPLEDALDRVVERARGRDEPPAARPAPLAAALEELWQQPSRVLLEVGPGDALAALALQQPGAAGRVAIPSLFQPGEGSSDAARMMEALGRLWLAGVEIDWSGGLHAGERRRRLPLPTYPFERRRFWVEPSRESDAERDRPGSWLHAPSWRRTPAASAASAPGSPGARTAGVLVAIGDAAGTLVPRLRERLAGAGRAPERTLRLTARADLENGGLELALRELGALSATGELVILAEGLHELSGGDLRPEHAALAAACRRSAREQGISCRVIDLPPFLDPLDRWMDRLGAEIAYGTGESVAYAPRGGRWECVLERTRGGGPGLGLAPGGRCFLLARGGGDDGLAEAAESWLTDAGVEVRRIEEPGPPPLLEILEDAPAPLGVVVVIAGGGGGGTVADAGRRLRAARGLARRTGGFCLVLAATAGGPEAEAVAAYAGLFALREAQGPDLLPWRSVIFEGDPPPASRGAEALLSAAALGAPEVIVRLPAEPSRPGLPLLAHSAPVAPPDERDLAFSQLKGIL